MKYPLSLLALIFKFGLLTAQIPSLHEPAFSSIYEAPTAPQKITGKILNLPPEATDTLEVGFAAVSVLADEQKELSVPLNPDGTFSLDLPENYPLREVWFWLGNYYYGVLLVENELSIELDFAVLSAENANGNWDAEGISFSGPDGALTRLRNQLISDQRRTRQNLFRQMIGNLRDQGKPLVEKQARLDSIYREIGLMDAKVLADAPAREKSLLENERETERFANTMPLYWGKEMPKELEQRYLDHRPLAMSNETRSFYSYFSTYLRGKATKRVAENMDSTLTNLEKKKMETMAYFDLLQEQYAPARADLYGLFVEDRDPSINYAKLTIAMDRIATPWVKGIKQKHFDRSVAAKKKMEAALSKKVEITSVKDLGEPGGSFAFGADQYLVAEDLSGQELLDKIRGAFAGQGIYLDFWAVWCSPCLMEMPYSAALHEKTEGLEVNYVYLCTDSGGSKESWEKLIATHEVPGIHLYVPEKVHDEIMEIFNGRGYPTYVFLHPNGEPVLDVSRPSQMDREKMEVLLREE
jgi:thiol-disulfide isomerase/thioredoxin